MRYNPKFGSIKRFYEYITLIKRVYKIDQNAAEYLSSEDIEKLDEFHYSGELDSVFSWFYSPQGGSYWKEIFLKLEDAEDEKNFSITISTEPYLMQEVITVERKYNPNYGDHRICICGHPYYRHFDSYDDMYDAGCKYCRCDTFVETIDNIKQCQICGESYIGDEFGPCESCKLNMNGEPCCD